MVRRVAEKVFIPFTVGGGIRTVADFRALLREGADKVSVNSAAIMRPELICEAADKFGSQCVVVAIDAKRRADGSGWNIYKNGGRVDMGIDAVEWAMRAEKLGGGRNPPHKHGLRRHKKRLRPGAYGGCGRKRLDSGDRLRRRGNKRGFLRRPHKGWGGRRPGGLPVSL